MYTRLPGRSDHGFGVHLAHAGDVLGHRAGKQLDILRQVADMTAEIVGLPLVEGGAVEAYRAAFLGAGTVSTAGLLYSAGFTLAVLVAGSNATTSVTETRSVFSPALFLERSAVHPWISP